MKNLLSVLVVIVFMCFGCEIDSRKEIDTDQRLRNVILSYMSNPFFVNSDFTKQVTGTDAQLEGFDLSEDMLYFSISEKRFDEKNTLSNLTNNQNNVEFGAFTEEGDGLLLGDYILFKTETYFFRFPSQAFKVQRDRFVRIRFGKGEYVISLSELADFIENRSVYGGVLYLKQDGFSFANHASVVAVPSEPSLKRLVSALIVTEDNKEKIAQRLLNFVTNNIKYSGIDRVISREVLKRPDEVLMTRNADCSGLTTLYASLLEQVGIDYRLFYIFFDGNAEDGHIVVAVEGNFSNQNGMTFLIGKKNYAVAETTVRGFKIGKSILSKQINVDDIVYVQKSSAA